MDLKTQTTSTYVWAIGLVVAALLLGKFVAYLRHPLRKFPGPLSAALSDFPICVSLVRGNAPFWINGLHEKYGPVVRTAPNELSFSSATSWKDIYPFRKGHKVFIKSKVYDVAAFVGESRSIVNEQDPAVHAKMRKTVAPAFSERSLREAHPLVMEVTDNFINEVRRRRGSTFDLTQWFSLVTFDLATTLALGECFDTVKAGKTHPWAVFFMNGVKAIGDAEFLRRFPLLKRLVLAFPPPQMRKMRKELNLHEEFCRAQIKKREESRTERPDIIGRLIDRREEEPVSTAFLAAMTSDFVIAGTDTTATALATANYYLMREPNAMKKLQEEIRGAFARYEDITPASTTDLKFLNAVINESLRIFPPVAWSPSRIVPPGGDTVDGHFLPAGVYVSSHWFSASHSAENFKDPFAFIPERWLDPDCTDTLDASQPFSLGPRNCIGRQLAWMEMRLIMAKMHFCFDLTPVDKNLDWVNQSKLYTLWWKPALNTLLEPREAA